MLTRSQMFCGAAVASILASPCYLAAQQGTGTLRLTIVDEETGSAVPARVEIRSADGAYNIAQDALPVGGDCDMSDLGAGLADLALVLAAFSDRVENPYTRSVQFYSDGESSIQLPSGPATIRIFKGSEYRVGTETVEVRTGATLDLEIQLSRWTNMPRNGWYSADDHLHIPRPVPELDPYISNILQAEDIHVGNLLQMGKVRNFTIAPQHAHGPDSYYQDGDYILAAGQENPRTHFLGHTITLGARSTINNPEKYLIYRLVWEESASQGALNGFAHGNFPEDGIVQPHNGMALWTFNQKIIGRRNPDSIEQLPGVQRQTRLHIQSLSGRWPGGTRSWSGIRGHPALNDRESDCNRG